MSHHPLEPGTRVAFRYPCQHGWQAGEGVILRNDEIIGTLPGYAIHQDDGQVCYVRQHGVALAAID